MQQWHSDPERVHLVECRVGTFYDEKGTAHRVNGHISANQIEFYIDPANPNARWDHIGGRKFVYSRPVDGIMMGFQIDGHQIAGLATQHPE